MIKAIIFDCFGVLTTDLWKAFLEEIDDPKAVEKARELNRAYDVGIISTEEFLSGVKDATGKEPTRVESLLIDQGEVVKNEPLLKYTRELKKRGYKLGMISNIATNWIRDSLLEAEEQSLFDDMVFSFEVGMVKPDPRIYQLACRRLKVEPEEAVFIDDIDRYCEAAEAEGMHAIMYTDLQSIKKKFDTVLQDTE